MPLRAVFKRRAADDARRATDDGRRATGDGRRAATVLLMPWVWVVNGGGLVWSAAGGWRYNHDPPWWDHAGGWVRVEPPADGWQFRVERGVAPALEPPPPAKRHRLA